MRAHWILAVLIGLGALVGCRGSKQSPPPRPIRIIDLTPQLSEEMVLHQYGRRACEFFGLKEQTAVTRVRPQQEQRTFGFSYFEILSHGGAHLDAAARLLRDGQRPADVPLESLYGWIRMVDVRWHDRSSPITITDLENYKIKKNEVVVINVGYVGPKNDDWPEYAYLSDQAAQWLASRGIRAVATDMPSLVSLRQVAEQMEKRRSPTEIWSAHIPFFEKDIPVIEGLTNLDALLTENRAYFVGFPLPLSDRSAAPVRAAALIFE